MKNSEKFTEKHSKQAPAGAPRDAGTGASKEACEGSKHYPVPDDRAVTFQMATDAITPTRSWLATVPYELHGHRKKLLFFLRSLERFRVQRELAPADVRVVEVGCSNGRNISLPLAEHGYQVTGVDIHAPSIAYAQACNTFPNARFICQDFSDFVSEEQFDVVVLSDILEHVDAPQQMINTALAGLAPGGMLLVCIPNGYGPYENEQRFLRATGLDKCIRGLRSAVKRLLGRRPQGQVAYNHDSGHVQFFRVRDFRELVENAGLRIEEQANGALFGGDLTYIIGTSLPLIVRPTWWIADRLPSAWASTWYFRLSRVQDRRQA